MDIVRSVRLALAAASLVLVHCKGGGASAPEVQPPSDEPVIADTKPAAAPLSAEGPAAPALGDGWDDLQERYVEPCVRVGAVVLDAPLGAYLDFDPRSDARPLGIDRDRRRFARLGGDDAAAAIARAMLGGDATQSGAWLRAQLRVRRMDGLEPELLVDPAAPGFSARCGDQLVLAEGLGGEMFVAWRIDYASAAAREELVQRHGSEVVGWAGRDGAATRAALAAWKGRAQLTVFALQRGGDPAVLSAEIGDGTTSPGWKRTCAMDALAPCVAFVRRVYAAMADDGAASFARTIETAPATLSVGLESWQVLYRDLTARRMPFALIVPRSALLSELDAQIALRARLDVLGEGVLTVPPAMAARLPALRATLAANLAVLEEAAKDCWDRISDPDDAAQVATCSEHATHAALVAHGLDDTLTVESLAVE